MGTKHEEIDPEYDVFALAKEVAASDEEFPPIYDSCGGDDFLLEINRAFATELKDLGADVTWKEIEGFGHEWRFWDQEVEQFLDWLPREDVYAKMGKRSC